MASANIAAKYAATSASESIRRADGVHIRHVSPVLRKQLFAWLDEVLGDDEDPEFDLSEAAERKFRLSRRTAERECNRYFAHSVRLAHGWRNHTANAVSMMRESERELLGAA